MPTSVNSPSQSNVVVALPRGASFSRAFAEFAEANLAERVINCYDLMDAAYCSEHLRAHSRSLGHVPLIDHNPRRGEKKEFMPHEAERYKERIGTYCQRRVESAMSLVEMTSGFAVTTK